MSEFVLDFDSAETGAPVLNNAAGSTIGVLDACLTTGFNNKAITSLAVASNVATATCAAHGYSAGFSKDVELAGSVVTGGTPGALNGRKQLTFIDANTFKFAAPGVADQTATGTITAKRAPLGWTKLFSGTNKAIYKRTDVQATAMLLYVDDTAAAPATTTDCRVRMIESATDINTLTGLAPTDAQVSGGHYWNKGANSAAAKPWTLVGTSRGFYFAGANGAGTPTTSPGVPGSASISYFGDFASTKAGDAYNCLLVGQNATGSGNSLQNALGHPAIFAFGVTTCIVARAHTQVGVARACNTVGIGNAVSGASNNNPAYPSPIDNGIFIFPSMLINEDLSVFGNPARGAWPGLAQVLGQFPFTHRQIVDPVVSLPGRKLIAVNIGANGSGGEVLIDLTGPWM